MRRGVAVFLGTAILIAAWGGTVQAADEWGTVTIPAGKPVKIALGAMLTGDYAGMGLDIKYGAEMAVQEKGKDLSAALCQTVKMLPVKEQSFIVFKCPVEIVCNIISRRRLKHTGMFPSFFKFFQPECTGN